MVNKDTVNCEMVWREVSNYLEGEVDEGLRSAMDAHFQTCQRCNSVLEGTRNVVQLYGDERMIEVPAGFGRRLEKRLAQSQRARVSRRWSTWSAWLVPVAALILIAGGLRVAQSWRANPQRSEHAQPPKGIPPDLIVVVAADAKLFHTAGCDVIRNAQNLRTLTAKQAMQEGFTPCPRCMRKYLETSKMERLPDGDAEFEEDARYVEVAKRGR
jgi:anti-sigma factor RsiW